MYGFVLWMDRARRGPVGPITMHRIGDAATITGECFGMHTCPLRSTPEAAAESQPIVSPTTILTYSGYVGNRRDVANLLGQPKLASAPDGSVILAAYTAWGGAFPAKLHGEYTFVILDRGDARVLAGRDALGLRKLYVLVDSRRLWIASNLAMLLASLPEAPSLDVTGIAHFLACGGTLGPLLKTLFRGILYVPAGHTLENEGAFGPVHQRPFWTADINREMQLPRAEDYEEKFRTLLFDGVEAALRAPGLVCTELSGGLDSSTVTAAAATLLRGRGSLSEGKLLAFSVVASETRAADESRYQAQFRSQYPIDHRQFDLDDLSDVMQVGGLSQPAFADMQGWFLEAQRRVVTECAPTVWLTGQGGDAVFGLTLPPLYLAGLLRKCRVTAWVREIAALLKAGRFNLWQLLWVYSRGDVLHALGNVPPRAPAWLTADLRTLVDEAQRTILTATCGRFSSNVNAFHYHLVATLAASLPDHERFSFEPRSPLLSLPLVEFMIGISWKYKVTADSNRVLQRRALRDILPKTIANRTTKGDFTPRLFSALRRRWDFWEPLTTGKHLADLGLIDPSGLRRSCEALRHGVSTDSLSVQCAALLLEQWLRTRRIRSDEPSLRRFREDASVRR